MSMYRGPDALYVTTDHGYIGVKCAISGSMDFEVISAVDGDWWQADTTATVQLYS